ncbi:hypothetical protein EV143_102258 [Flavobacterium chryseum]|uniref:hypothetical protein n=1 Tax=Flavobacterium sp. P3160 TaxID=2512113 RepID=UPI00105CAF3E|nr:hypothetical protein [Flavobacterium sp. P3160]TDO82996.1 hypothetical protein EV143_102258 [Flavobacterium sp. P3160]
MEKIKVQKLKKTLDYLESKQRELNRNNETDTRTIESMIKYLKKDMLDQFNLSDYHISIQQEIKNTEAFINNVKNIIDINSED